MKKAVIMAGGVGNRLRPLTCTIPKPMARLCGKPMIQYILDLLCEYSFEEAEITLKYLPDCIMDYFPDGEYKGMKLGFNVEEKALGTAGSVRYAAKKFTEDFLVISGDALCNYNLDEIMNFHKDTKADATLVCTRVDDPREYGLINASSDGKILGFTEKPGWEQVSTNLANTGIYVLNPSVLSLIEENKSVDFACDVFPSMLENKAELRAFEAKGYWCDIGDFEAYKNSQFDLLNGIENIPIANLQDGISYKSNVPSGKYTLIQPAYIGENVNIGKNCILGPNIIIDDAVSIGENTRINNSVILQGAYIAPDVRVNAAIICEDAVLKRSCDVFEGSVIGSYSIIGENATIANNVLVWPEKNIAANARVNDNIREGNLSADILENDAICGESFAELTSERAARLGAAAGSTKLGKRVGVAHDGSTASKTLAMALISGLLSTGGAVWDFGECLQSQLNYFTAYCELKIGIFVSTEDNFSSIKIVGDNALPLDRQTERDISSRYKRRDFLKCPTVSCSEISDMSSLFLMYRREILAFAKEDFKGINVNIRCENPRIYRYITGILSNLGCVPGGELSFIIDETGENLQAFDENSAYVDSETLLTICCLEEFSLGFDVAIPYDAPAAINEIANHYGRKVYRFMDSSGDGVPDDTRFLIFSNIWSRDALFMLMKILNYMERLGKTLVELVKELPEFHIQKKILEIDISPSHLLEVFNSITGTDLRKSQGIKISGDKGEIRLTPAKNGKTLKIISEAYSEETAAEICGEIEEKIKNECKKMFSE